MNAGQQKVMQYLGEAHASELALVRVLQSQIAMTPRGTYRTGLEKHLVETRDHAKRVARRLDELGIGANPFMAVVGAFEAVVGQTLALGKAPFDLLRGSGGEEKVLKNAKDACATEALEIATYTAIEKLANAVGDTTTAKLAASIRADEEKMLERILREIPKLTQAVVGADVDGNGSYDVATTGAGETVRKAAKTTKRTARKATTPAGPPIARYDKLTADEIVAKLSDLSQTDLAKVDAYERRNQNRSTVLGRVSTLRTREPWSGYDELSAGEVQSVLSEGDEDRAKRVRAYEAAHKNRTGVLQAAGRETTKA